MTGEVVLVVVVWFGLALVVANYAQEKGYSTTTFAFLSVFLSPLVSGLIVFFVPDKSKDEDAVAPAVGPASSSAVTPVGVAWKADPTGRHEQRFWDGTGWTDNVLDSGTPGRDPL